MSKPRKYYLLMSAMLGNIIVALLPGYWWYYSVGGIVTIKDSLFGIYLQFLGREYEIIKLINIILFAFKFYVITISAYYLYKAYLGERYNYMLIMWASYLYILDPIIAYLISNYLLGLFIKVNYPFFIIGSESINVEDKGVEVSMLIQSYPYVYYWIALAIGTLNLITRFVKK